MGLSQPQEDDVNDLKKIILNANDFDYFASRMDSPGWFALMDRDMVKYPSGGSPWLLHSLVSHLKDAHVNVFISMVKKNFDYWVTDDVGSAELGFVGYMLGDRGLPWLVRALEKNKDG